MVRASTLEYSQQWAVMQKLGLSYRITEHGVGLRFFHYITSSMGRRATSCCYGDVTSSVAVEA